MTTPVQGQLECEKRLPSSTLFTWSDAQIRKHIKTRKLDRRQFIPAIFKEVEYKDEPVMIENGLTVPPRSLAELVICLAAVTPFDHVLEIGTGSGYLTRLLSYFVREVHSMDVRDTSHLAPLLPTNAFLYERNGIYGVPEEAPYDAIVVQAAVPGILNTWFDQLREGGRIIAPVGEPAKQELRKFAKIDGVLRDLGTFAYVRYVPLQVRPGSSAYGFLRGTTFRVLT
jgi:protein-L-isoaspartate(D-aspartate) O-methyltransferase